MTTMAPPSTAPTSPTALSTNSISLVSFIAPSPIRSTSMNVRMRRGKYLRRDTGLRSDSELGGPADQLGLRGDAELGGDRREVALDRALAQVEVVGDLDRRLTA